MLLGLTVSLEGRQTYCSAAAEMQDWKHHMPAVQVAISNAWRETVQESLMFLKRAGHPKTPPTVDLPHRPASKPIAFDCADQMRAMIP